jgi:hypothetical protein
MPPITPAAAPPAASSGPRAFEAAVPTAPPALPAPACAPLAAPEAPLDLRGWLDARPPRPELRLRDAPAPLRELEADLLLEPDRAEAARPAPERRELDPREPDVDSAMHSLPSGSLS